MNCAGDPSQQNKARKIKRRLAAEEENLLFPDEVAPNAGLN